MTDGYFLPRCDAKPSRLREPLRGIISSCEILNNCVIIDRHIRPAVVAQLDRASAS